MIAWRRRAEFVNAGRPMVLRPTFAALARAPFVISGPVLERVREKLAAGG